MTTKKLGKIMLLSTIPNMLTWATSGIVWANKYHPQCGDVPTWWIIWLVVIVVILVTGACLAEGFTIKGTWKAIVKFINE